MNRGFRQYRFGFMLLMWFILIDPDAYAAEASADANASVASQGNANNAVSDLLETSFVSDAIAGRTIIRIGGAGLYIKASGGEVGGIAFTTLFGDSGLAYFSLADFIKRVAASGLLSGAVTSSLTLGAAGATGFVNLTVGYN